MITQEKASVIYHKRNAKEVKPSKKVPLWRGMDKKTYKYILSNKYYPDIILSRNSLEFMIDLKNQKQAS